MTKTFTEFSTNATLKVGDESLLTTFSDSKAIGLYTFIWARKTPIHVMVDGVPLTIKAHQILHSHLNKMLNINRISIKKCTCDNDHPTL